MDRKWYNMRMKMISYCLVFVSACAMAGGDAKGDAAPEKEAPPKLAAVRTRLKCAICGGKGSLKVRPRDVGQFAGRIEDRSHFDIKVDPCPICGKGHGWRTVWDLTQPEPRTERPCSTCGWSGLVQCRSCLASGIVKCPHSGCKDGWIETKVQSTSRRSSSRKPPIISACPECKGVGKVVCPVCKGMRADLCRKCLGLGRKMK